MPRSRRPSRVPSVVSSGMTGWQAFLAGAASILNIFPSPSGPRLPSHRISGGLAADRRALKGDWNAIASDLSRAAERSGSLANSAQRRRTRDVVASSRRSAPATEDDPVAITDTISLHLPTGVPVAYSPDALPAFVTALRRVEPEAVALPLPEGINYVIVLPLPAYKAAELMSLGGDRMRIITTSNPEVLAIGPGI